MNVCVLTLIKTKHYHSTGPLWWLVHLWHLRPVNSFHYICKGLRHCRIIEVICEGCCLVCKSWWEDNTNVSINC